MPEEERASEERQGGEEQERVGQTAGAPGPRDAGLGEQPGTRPPGPCHHDRQHNVAQNQPGHFMPAAGSRRAADHPTEPEPQDRQVGQCPDGRAQGQPGGPQTTIGQPVEQQIGRH